MKLLLPVAFFTLIGSFETSVIDFRRHSLEPTIVGGNNASRRAFPYMVSIQARLHMCGGSIIKPTWVLTAAHCFSSAYGLTAVAGILNLQENHPDNQRIPATGLIRHPDFNDFNASLADIALIKLQYGFSFTEAVQPIALPQPYQEFSGRVVVSGWGRNSVNPSIFPDHLQFLEMPIISNEECSQRLKSSGDYPWEILYSHVCVLPEKREQSACHADSGGPLAQNGANGKVLVGIVHGGDSTCGHGFEISLPNVYTKVSHYIEFITKYVPDLH